MILVNSLYTVLVTIIIIVITTLYLIDISAKPKKEHLLYIQSNSTYALQKSQNVFHEMNVLNNTSLVHNLNVGKIFLNSFDGYTRSGRFVAMFSNPGDIQFRVIDDKQNNIGNYKAQNIVAYYPVYIEFRANKDSQNISLQYETSLTSIVLYKLSIEFY